MHVCSIIAKNYVAQARVLARSFHEHHPGGTFWLLVIDDVDGYIDASEEPFELVTTADLGIEHFHRMAALYTVLELSTAVKPWFLRHLLHERGAERVAYLDPDIKIYSSLEEVDDLMREHHVVVTPHITEPLPRDGKRPSETDLLIAGAYNLGFIGLARGDDTDRLLDWWADRLERDCIVAPERGFFVDQRWMDFAPGLVPSFHVLRDPGYNVAYWNLPGREVKRRRGDGWEVNGSQLRFFHFSGYDPDRRGSLSLHQDRVVLRREPVLRELCEGYAEDLLDEGYAEVRHWPYTYAALPDGTPLEDTLRAAYRELEADSEQDESIFTAGGARRFLAWLNEPLHGRGRDAVTRYLDKVWHLRPDLQLSFPQIDAEDGPAFVSWSRVHGRSEVPIPPALVPGARRDGQEGSEPPAAVIGVNAIGYFGSVLGVGEAGRQVVSALEARGVPVARVPLSAELSPDHEGAGAAAAEAPSYPVNLLCVNADMVPYVAANMPAEFFERRHTVGLWWWEVGAFPDEWLPSFGYVDEVWVGSHHIAEALAPIAPVPVIKIRQPVPVPSTPSGASRAELGLPEGPLFLFSFDYLSVFERKNPLALVEAFSRAFPEPGQASLVIKSINHESDEPNRARLAEAAAAREDVTLIESYLPRAERDALVASCDCYVSLHRSEGFGFTLAEAMALGRPVIATGYSGNLDFMSERNGFLVDYALTRIGDGADPYPADGEWAEPDLEHAAELMRRVVAEPGEASERAQRGRREILERHSPEAAGAVMVERLRRLRSRAGHRSGRGPSAAASHTAFVERRVRGGPPGAAEGTPRARRVVRQGLLKALKPYTAHQRQVDEDLLRVLKVLEESIDGLAASVETLSAGQAALRAEMEPALRLVRPPGLDGRGEGAELPEAPPEYWSPEYIEVQRAFVAQVLDDPELLMHFKHGHQLPPRYGVRFDERVVEFPWVATRKLAGRVLDAGSSLNHPHILSRLRPRVDELHIATLSPEPEAYPSLDVSYLYADLRELPMRDGAYDHVVSVSTLEHVGMDTSQYGAGEGRADDPRAELRRALGELRRVLKPGGSLYVTVPYGASEDLGWLWQFGAEELEQLVDAFGPSQSSISYYGYEPKGWRLYEDPRPLAECHYRDHFTQPLAEDGAAAARAVACLELVAPAG